MAAAYLFSDEGAEERRKMREKSLRIGQNLIWERINRGKTSRTATPAKLKLKQEQLIPIDLLAEEWLQGDSQDKHTKLYLIERVLPVLVMGLENLLVQVGKKGLEDQEGFRVDFNPINILAQFLMRNNPRYRHCVPAPSPYSIGLSMVTARLRKIAMEGDEPVEVRVKERLMEKKSKDELAHKEKLADEQNKRDSLKTAALLWNGNKGIPKLQVQQVIRAWLDEMRPHPQYDEIFNAFANIINPLADVGTHWSGQDFIDTILPGCLTLKFDSFILFGNHLHTCGKERKRALQKEKRMSMFKDVFEFCDNAKLTLVDRQQLLSLLCIYYDNSPSKMKEKLVNPNTWVIKWDDTDGKIEECDEWEKEGSTVSDEDYQQFMSPVHAITSAQGATSNETVIDGTTSATEILDDDGPHIDDIKDSTSTREAEETSPSVVQRAGSTGNAGISRKGSKPESAIAPVPSSASSSPLALPPVPNGPGGQWSPKHIALPQFLELCNLFMGETPEEGVAESLATFIRLNFHKDEMDLAHLAGSSEMHRTLVLMKRAQKVSAIFLQWDINCSGFLSLDELETVLSHWEPFTTQEGKKKLKSAIDNLAVVNKQVSKTDFSFLMDILTDKMTSLEFKEFTNFVVSSIKMTHEQQKRSAYRQQLLHDLRSIGDSSTINIVPSLESGVKTIQMDSVHFAGKPFGVCIALLEYNDYQSSSPYLSYKAASDECIYNVLGKKLNRAAAPVSFSAVDSCSPVHVPNVHKHGKVHFFIPSHSNKNEYSGSLVVTPIITPTGLVIGTISIDSIIPNGKPQKFTTHEISFYQGVGVCLGEIYQSTMAKRRLIGAAKAGIVWLLRRCVSIVQIDFYMIMKESPTEEEQETVLYSLQHTLTSNQSHSSQVNHCEEIIKRKDNFFRDYLFQCVDTSESVSAEAYCYPHLACPLRDTSGCAVAVIDFTISPHCNGGRLQPQDLRDVGKMVKLLTTAFHRSSITDAEDNGSTALSEDSNSIMILFHKLLLADLQSSMGQINKRAFAELRSYIEPPKIIFSIVKALIMILHPDITEDISWNECKQYVTVKILQDMAEFKPSPDHKHPRTQEILKVLEGIPPVDVYQHGSLPAKYLYNWVTASSTVLEQSANSSINAGVLTSTSTNSK